MMNEEIEMSKVAANIVNEVKILDLVKQCQMLKIEVKKQMKKAHAKNYVTDETKYVFCYDPELNRLEEKLKKAEKQLLKELYKKH